MRLATRHLVFPMGAILTLGAGAAVAQTSPAAGAPPAANTVDEVVVTGSLIARRDYVAESPIVTVGQDVIDRSGAVTVEQALNQLPQFGASAGASSNLNSAGGRASADLRGLGPQRTLVLLDGRRMQPSSTDGSIDLNTIPDLLIGNVEVITGGASAIYGSDAIAGVVNFKLRHVDGLEMKLQYGGNEHGDGATQNVSLAAGSEFAEGRGNAVLSLSYTNREPVFGADRPFFTVSNLTANLPFGIMKPDARNLPSQAAVNSIFSAYGVTAGSVPRTNTFGFNTDGTLYSAGNPATHLTDNLGGNTIVVFNNTYQYNTGLIYYLQLPLTKYSTFARAEYEVAPDVKVYGQAYYTHYTALTQIVPPVLGGTGVPSVFVPVTNPFISSDLRTLLASRPNPTAPFIFSKRLAEAGNRVERDNWNVYQVEAGASGKLPLGDLTWDVFASRGETNYQQVLTGTPSLSAIQALLNASDGGRSLCDGGYNPFGLTALSASCQGFISRTLKNTTNLTRTNVQATLQGGLLTLPAGELRFAAGLDFREEQYSFEPDNLLVHLDVVNQQTTLPSSGRTSVKEAFGELLVPILKDAPLVESLDADLAYRYSDYDRIGGVSTYKASLDWKPTSWLLVRGGYQRAIRAPNVGELFTALTSGSVNLGTVGPVGSGDPCDVASGYRTGANAAQVRGLCLAQGVPQALLDSYKNTNPLTVTRSGGNQNLTEEQADTYSVGAVIRPKFEGELFGATSLSVDYYNISLTQAIGTITGDVALSKCFNADGSNPGYSVSNLFCSLVSRETATGLISTIQTPLLNLGGYKTSGVDVEGDWEFPLSALGAGDAPGRLGFNVVVSYLRSFRIENLPNAPFVDYAGTIGNTQVDPYAESHPRWKSSTTASYELGPVRTALTWRYIDAMSNAANVGTTGTAPGVKSRNYFDLDLRWAIKKDLVLEGGVVNLFDKDPPLFGTTPGTTDLSLYDVVGRRYYVSLRAKF